MGDRYPSLMLSMAILIFSAAALVRFGVGQWRAIWISTAYQPVSGSLLTSTGIETARLAGTDFHSLVALYSELCAGAESTAPWLPELKRYYRVVSRMQRMSETAFPRFSTWAAQEMTICSRYVAVAIDQYLCIDFDRRSAIPS